MAKADTVTPGDGDKTATATKAPAAATNQQSSVVPLKTVAHPDSQQAAAAEDAQQLNDQLTDSKQAAEVQTKVNFTGDNESATVDVANAHAGDTYQVVFHTDPHLTLNYTPGPLTQQGVVDSSQTVDADGAATYSGKFLKAATINQPFIVRSGYRQDILNTPGTYYNSAELYFNGKLINTVKFAVDIPRQKVDARWDSVDNHGNPVPDGISSLQYHEGHPDYWLVPGDDHQYQYSLTVDGLPAAFDHQGVNVNVGVPKEFVIDGVVGKRANGNRENEELMKDKDFAFSQDANGVHITLRKGLDDHYAVHPQFNFTLIGHYHMAQPDQATVLSPATGSTVNGNDGAGKISAKWVGIQAPFMGKTSLSGYSFGELVAPELDVFPDESNVELANGDTVHNAYWLNRNHSDKAWFSAYFTNSTLVDAPAGPVTFYLPDHYELTKLTVDNPGALTDVVYHYGDGSTSTVLDSSKHVTAISGTIQLANTQSSDNKLIVGFVGHLDPHHQFQQKENLVASIGKNGDSMYKPGVLTTIDFVKRPQPTYDLATIQNNIESVVLGTNASAGSIHANIYSWHKIDHPSAQFVVTIPKNTVVSSISRDSKYWQDPVYTTTINGQQQLTFTLQPNLTKEQLANIQQTPVVYLQSTSIYVPALKSEDGFAEIIMNGKEQARSNFTVSLVVATADYLITSAQGNMDAAALNQATNDDKKTAQVTLNYDFINGNSNTNLTGLTFLGNLPQKQDGKSQVDIRLTGPIHVVDYLTGQSMDSNVTISYSTNYYQPGTVNQADLTGFVSADQVHDWSQIKSFRVNLLRPLTGGSVCQIQAPAQVVNQVNNVNKVAYLSGAVFGDGIMPYRLLPAGNGSAEIKIQGISTVHQRVHYVDASGQSHDIDLGPSHDIHLTDNVDKLTVNGFPTGSESLLPKYYHWDQQSPVIENDQDAHYPDGLPNKTAQLNTVSQYYFDNDTIVWNLVPDEQEQITVDQLSKYYYYGSNQPAAPDYTRSVPAIVYLNPFTQAVEGIELQQELPAVSSPQIQNYHAIYGQVNAWQAQHQYTIDSGISLDLAHHVAHIRNNDYYVSAAAQLVVVDPNTHMAKKVELAYDDGSHQIKFADNDEGLQLSGYQMHVYYLDNSGAPVYNDDIHRDGSSFNLKTDPLVYPYSINEETGSQISPQQENYLQFDNSFPGYDSLAAAMGAKDADGKANDQYDDQIDLSEDSNGRITLTPTQIFFVFYTPVQQDLQEQFLITADNDPLANSKSNFLKRLAIPKSQEEAAHSDLYQSTGKAGTVIFPKNDGTGSAQLPLPTDPYMGGMIDLTSPQYAHFADWLINNGYATRDDLESGGGTVFNNSSRPGYVIDRADYQFTNDDGITNTYSIQMHTPDELSALIKKQPHAKVLISEGSAQLRYMTNITGDSINGFQGDSLNDLYAPTYDDFREVGPHHYLLDVYADQSYSANQPAVPVLLSMKIFNPNGQNYGPSILFDQTVHEAGTPDPHPQVLNVHFKHLRNIDTYMQNGNIEVHYQDVSNLQPNQAGKYVYGGGYEANGQFSKGTDYDAGRLNNAANQDPAIGQMVNYPYGASGASRNYRVGTMDNGGTGVMVSFSHGVYPSTDYQTPVDNWNHYDISAVNNYVASDDQYVIVQEDPEAQNGDHTWDLLNPAGYASADDPTGEKTLAKYMLQYGNNWASMGLDYPQVYYVYLKRKQKINYRVLVEDKDGHVVKVLTPETLLGVGGSNEQVATTKVNGALSTDPTTIGDRYQSIVKQLANRGFQAVTKASGQLRVSDSLDQLTFDNDATKDQLLTIYVTQPKTVQVHYVDVDGSAKTSHYTVNDGTDLLDHMQTISGLAGDDYHNSHWDWTTAGYVLATSEDQIDPGTTHGSFQLTDPASRAYYIYLKHNKQTVSDHQAVKQETIHYVYEDGSQALPDYHAPAITFKRTGTYDQVTKKTAWNPWTTDNDTFAAVDSPTIDGYRPDIERVNAIKMTVGNDNVEKTVTYARTPDHNTPGEQPGHPGENPGQPGHPGVPGQQPGHPGENPGQPGYPGVPGQTASLSDHPQNAVFSHQAGQHPSQPLPQTGNAGSRWSVVGLALSSLLGFIGWDKRRKQN